jgi:hypothetical protein
MRASVLTANAIGAAIVIGLALICIYEIGMRQQPKPPAIFWTVMQFLTNLMFAAIALAAYWGTLHKPPSWVNALCLVVAVALILWDLAIAICAGRVTITKKDPPDPGSR